MSLKRTLLASVSALVLGASANATTFNVPGTSDPWLAGQPDGTPASSNDVAPGQSPVFAGSFSAGAVICWTADGFVLNYPGTGGFDPNGDPNWIQGHDAGAENGISNIVAPLNSLIGVWYGGGIGTTFFMGSSGSATVPAGATDLYLGTMDGYEWNNNSGSFNVTVGVCGVPDSGSTMLLTGLAMAALAGAARKARRDA